MSSQIHFETPENIEVGYDLAGLGSRFAAWALDQILVTLVVIVLFIALLTTGAVGDSILDGVSDVDQNGQPELQAYVIGFLYLLFSLGSFFYFGFSELFMRGQTVGKRRLGLRVVQSDGFELRPLSILLRSVFRVADHLPLLWIVPFVTDRNRRFGDLVAGTIVVSDRPSELSDVRRQVLGESPSESAFRIGNAVSKLTAKDVDVVERVLERLPSVTGSQKRSLLQSMATPLAERLGMPLPDSDMQEQFLRDLLAAHYQREYRRLG